MKTESPQKLNKRSWEESSAAELKLNVETKHEKFKYAYMNFIGLVLACAQYVLYVNSYCTSLTFRTTMLGVDQCSYASKEKYRVLLLCTVMSVVFYVLVILKKLVSSCQT